MQFRSDPATTSTRTPPATFCGRVRGRVYDAHGNDVTALAPFLDERLYDWRGFPVKGTSPDARPYCRPTAHRPPGHPTVRILSLALRALVRVTGILFRILAFA